MSKKKEFIKWFETIMDAAEVSADNMPEDVKKYWDAFCSVEEAEKPAFTDNGKMILRFLQDNTSTEMWKARDIAEGLFMSSRGVSGAMRKLVDDGYVEKLGSNPSVYSITELGKSANLNDEN